MFKFFRKEDFQNISKTGSVAPPIRIYQILKEYDCFPFTCSKCLQISTEFGLSRAFQFVNSKAVSPKTSVVFLFLSYLYRTS